jgi:Skp family chaperone for outer membrane proteins
MLMKRKSLFFLILFFLGFIASPALAARPAAKIAKPSESFKVGVYDMQRVMKESKVIQGYRRILEKDVGEKRKLYADKQEALKEMESRLRKDAGGMSLLERTQLGEKLAQGLKELQRLREDLDVELQKKDRELGQRVMKEVSGVIRDIGKKDHYAIIFEQSSSGIAYFDRVYDITTKLIKQYDAKE